MTTTPKFPLQRTDRSTFSERADVDHQTISRRFQNLPPDGRSLEEDQKAGQPTLYQFVQDTQVKLFLPIYEKKNLGFARLFTFDFAIKYQDLLIYD